MNVHTLKVAAFVTATILVLSCPAQAEEGSNTYLRGSIGLNRLNDADNTGSGLDIKSEFDSGYLLSGAIGRSFSKNMRVEGEVSYRKNDADALSITNAGSFAGLGTEADGDVGTLSVMGNLYYDFTQTDSAFVPYVTGGLGFARINADISAAGVQLVDDSDTALAYQLGVGFGHSIADNTLLDIGYRYFATRDPELTDAGGSSFDSEYSSHAITAGLRYQF